MFKIFDLHNDYFFKLNTETKKNNYFLKNEDYIEKAMSVIWTSELNEIESCIEKRLNELNALVKSEDFEKIQLEVKELLALIKERNSLCKALKK